MDIRLNKPMIDIVLYMASPDPASYQKRQNQRYMLLSKRPLKAPSQKLSDSSARRFRLLYKYGIMLREDRGHSFLYYLGPRGLAIADLLKLQLTFQGQ